MHTSCTSLSFPTRRSSDLTSAPETFEGFYHQRKRWARGMIEGLKRYGHLVWKSSRLSAFFVGVDFIIPFIDLFYAFRSEEHTSELQSQFQLVCRPLLEKKK